MTKLFATKQLIPFNVIGDPNPAATVANVLAQVQAGARLIELGLPFSDPVADGPAVKAANQRALRGQLTVAQALATVAAIRAQSNVALVLMTYVNIPFVYGFDAFAARVAALDITGIIVPDLPHEEAAEFRDSLARHGVDLLTIVGPATPERIATVAAPARGFLTVSPALPQPILGQEIAAIRAASDLPIVVNLPTADTATIQALAPLVEGIQLTETFVSGTAVDPGELARPVTELRQALQAL